MTEETRNENTETAAAEQPTEQRQEAPKEQPAKESTENNSRDDYVSKDELQAAQDRIHQLNKENQKRREQIKEWEGLKEQGYDPEKLSELVKQQKEMERKQMEEQGRYQELIEEIQNETQTKIQSVESEYKEREEKYKSALHGYLVENEATKALAKENVADSRILNDYVRKRMQVMEGEDGKYKTVILDDNGEPKVKRGGAPYTASDLVAEMKEDAEFSRLFPAPNISGSNTTSNSTPASKAPATTKPRSKMTPKEKSDFQTEYGFDAYWQLPL